MSYWLEELRDNRALHLIFEYLLPLNFEEYNLLIEYLENLPEFNEWHELNFKLDIKSDSFIYNEILITFNKKEILGRVLREKVKSWWLKRLEALENMEE